MEEALRISYNPELNHFRMVIPLNSIFKKVKIDEEVYINCRSFRTIGSVLQDIRNELINIFLYKFKRKSYQLRIKNSEVQISLSRKRREGYKIIPDKLALSIIMSQDHKTTRMTIFDKEFRIIVNSPEICDFVLPPVLYATFSVCPIRFRGFSINHLLCKFNWYRSKDKIVWEKVDGNYFYMIKLEDVGYFLKMTCIPVSRENVEGTCVEVVSKKVVRGCPEIPQYPFELRHAYTKISLSEQSYRVISYNPLPNRKNYKKYSYCLDEFLAIDYRKELILREILGYNADIICLQGVNQIEYFRFFKVALLQKGYLITYYNEGFASNVGMVCALRYSRFKLISERKVVFSEDLRNGREIYGPLYDFMRYDKRLMKKLTNQLLPLVIMKLKCEDGSKILLANMQTTKNPLQNNIKLIQSYMALRFLKSMKETLVNLNPSIRVNIILCGNFNCTPNSVVYNFICNGKLEFEDYLEVSGRLFNLRHNFKFKSACGTPKYTKYTPTSKKCIDYIFIEDETTEVKQIVPFLEEELEKYSAIPNKVYPSDHLASVVDIKFKE